MPGDEVAEELPRELNPSNSGAFLVVEKNKLSVRYTGTGQHNHDVGSIQANCTVPRRRRLYYFEITVKDSGDRGCIAIGFAPPDFKAGRQPGWEPGSYGYHGDDGRKYASTGMGEEYGPHFGAGDTIGAGLHLETQELFFTKNGEHLGTAFRHVVATDLIPTIGLHSLNEAVEVNFGARPFIFDVDGQLRQEREQQAAAIAALEVPAGVTHQLVRQYLLHFGYARTLQAFDSAAGVLPDSADAPAESPECPELALRHAVRAAIDSGDVWEAERLVRDSQYAHLLEPRHGAASAASAASGDASGIAAGPPAAERGSAAAAVAGSRGVWIQPSSMRSEQAGSVPGGSGSGSDGGNGSRGGSGNRAADSSGGGSGGGSAADAAADVYLHLSCQKFVELVRAGRIDEAVAFGQKVLGPLMRVSPAYTEVVTGVFALVAYQDPESSAMADLLSLAAREATADVLNAAVLAAAAPTPDGSVAMDSPEAAQPAAAPPTPTRAPAARRAGPPPPPPLAAGVANGSGGGGRQTARRAVPASFGGRNGGRNGSGGGRIGGGGNGGSGGRNGSGGNGGGGGIAAGLTGLVQSAQALVGMGLEDPMGAEFVAEELSSQLRNMDVPPTGSPEGPPAPQQQQQGVAAGSGGGGGGGGGGSGRRAAESAARPAPAPPRPKATLQRLLAQLVVVRQQMHEANGGQGEVFRLAEHMAPPEPLKPKTA